MEWTREMKYRTLEDVSSEEINRLINKVDKAPWRQTYHIQPISGLLNDPNGLVYHDGLYHVLYQWHPLGAVHGMKYWYHLTSNDLVHFKAIGPTVKPNHHYDSHGAYSGSAIVVDNELKLVYTGNHRTKQWERIPYQVITTLNNNTTADKRAFVEGPPAGYTEHFRDPKVWYDSNRNKYYAVIGAQRANETGTIVVYESTDFKDWQMMGELKTDYKSFGYMWECPDYFNIDGHDIVLFCPQGIEPEGNRYRNIYQSGYLIGSLDFDSMTLSHDAFEELDHGFDFYAPQTMIGEHGERILIGWMGLPDIEYPTDVDEWAHCLTIPRTLSVSDDLLTQQPIKALQQLRQSETKQSLNVTSNPKTINEMTGTHYELIMKINDNQSNTFHIDLRQSEDERTRLTYDATSQQLTLDRSKSGELPNGVDGTSRTTKLTNPLSTLQIFVDTSSIEVFINDGERVMTARIFPKDSSDQITLTSEGGDVSLDMTKYDLKGDIICQNYTQSEKH